MTLPAASNAISLSQVNTELGNSSTAQISLNDAAVRSLFGKASGAISMSDGHGKSAAFSASITTNQQEMNLRTFAVSAGWNQSSIATITVNSNVYVWSDNVATAAMTINGSWPGGVTLVNNGFIMGRGGNGSGIDSIPGPGQPLGQNGGVGISIGVNCSITNNSGAFIAGGGGGGRGIPHLQQEGPCFTFNAYIGGGGGGAGGGAGGSGKAATRSLAPTSPGGSVGQVGTDGVANNVAGFYPSFPGRGASGGGGGRIFPGTGGAGGLSPGRPGVPGGAGGGAGGGGGGLASGGKYHIGQTGPGGGNGGSGGNAGTNSNRLRWYGACPSAFPHSGFFKTGGGGGGGWGAAGGTHPLIGGASTGGKAIALNGFTATRTGAGTTFGAVS